MTTQKTIEALIGKTIRSFNAVAENDCAILATTDGVVVEWYYMGDCCATCTISQVDGDPEALIGGVIHAAYIVRREGEDPTHWGHETWTFCHIRATTGDVCFRFHGESNGYYSEDIDCKVTADGETVRVWCYPYD
jgi:hypothetical protein